MRDAADTVFICWNYTLVFNKFIEGLILSTVFYKEGFDFDFLRFSAGIVMASTGAPGP